MNEACEAREAFESLDRDDEGLGLDHRPPAPRYGADSGRSGQPCPCHPPALGHLYGPALTCINLGCGVPYGTVSTPCPSPRNVYGAAQVKRREGATP